MSSSNYVFAGPFAKATFRTFTEQQIRNYEKCSCTKCGKSFGSRRILSKEKLNKPPFCSECGAPTFIKEYTNPIEVKKASILGIYDMLNEGGFREDALEEIRHWEEGLGGGDECKWKVPVHYLTPSNNDRNAPRNFYFEVGYSESELLFAYILPDIETEKKWFEEAYKPELDYLRTKYESIEIDWTLTAWRC